MYAALVMSACPICGRPAAARALNRALPFCSARCKLVDLGTWLDGGYAIPVPDESDVDPQEVEEKA